MEANAIVPAQDARQPQQDKGPLPGQMQDQEKPSKNSRPMAEVETGSGVVWKVGKKLGSGSFGDVFLAISENPDVQREVAIKVESLKAPHPQLA